MTKLHNPYYQAQAILSRRDHSEGEVREKLGQKKFTAEQIDQTITWLKAKHLVNDAQFARRYITSVLQGKAVGPRWLETKLKQKRVAAALITAALAEIMTREYERELVVRAQASWQRTHPQQANDQSRRYRFLLSRGFSPEVVGEVVSSTRRP